jgi:hypothetical protein
MQQLQGDVKNGIEGIESVIDSLIEHDQHALAGLLSYHVGQAILKATRSERLATGFLRAAAVSYRQAEMFGLCEMLREKWPAVCPAAPSHGILPSQALGTQDGTGPPPLRRASLSISSETVISAHSSGASSLERGSEAKKLNADQLDALA